MYTRQTDVLLVSCTFGQLIYCLTHFRTVKFLVAVSRNIKQKCSLLRSVDLYLLVTITILLIKRNDLMLYFMQGKRLTTVINSELSACYIHMYAFTESYLFIINKKGDLLCLLFCGSPTEVVKSNIKPLIYLCM